MNILNYDTVAAPPLGQHLIAEFCGASCLVDGAKVDTVLRQAAEAANAVVLDVRTHNFGDREGFTGVALLAESHISIHTWPENAYAAIDIFMCGDADVSKSLDVLRDYFQPKTEKTTILERGLIALQAAT